jgi:hypothetical protein
VASSAAPLQMTPRKGAADNDCEDSRISPSSFSKKSPEKSPKQERRSKSKSPHRVSFGGSEQLDGKVSGAENSDLKQPPSGDEDGRKVSFNKRVRIRKIRQLDDMAAEEIHNIYFTDDELVNIRNTLRSKIRVLVEQDYDEGNYNDEIDINDNDESFFCVRGLEHEFPIGRMKRRNSKIMARGAVLEEQRQQREFFAHNEQSSSTHTTLTTSSHTISTVSSHSASASMVSMIHEDPAVAIAEIYRIESKPAVQAALDVARRDQYIADQIYFAHQAI